MKTVEKYLQLGLAVILGFCFYLGASIYDRTFALGNDIEQIPAFTKPETNELKYEQPKIDNNEIFLVAYKNRLFRIENDFQVAESLNGIDAVGCGADYALGSLHILTKQNLTPKEKVLKSLETASFFSAGVSKPFVINGT